MSAWRAVRRDYSTNPGAYQATIRHRATARVGMPSLITLKKIRQPESGPFVGFVGLGPSFLGPRRIGLIDKPRERQAPCKLVVVMKVQCRHSVNVQHFK